MELREWIMKYRKKDYDILMNLVMKRCYPWIKDILDLYYCLSEIYKEQKNINIPLLRELAELIYNDILQRKKDELIKKVINR